LLPLYGLRESGDLWHKTLDDHHKNELKMKSLRSDSALYALMIDGILYGLSGSYVDDLLRCGDKKLRKFGRRTNERFDMAEDEEPPCTFTGFRLHKGKDGDLELEQKEYVEKLKPVPEDGTWKDFSSARMKLVWLANSRPDCTYEVAQLAQVTFAQFTEKRHEIIKRVKKQNSICDQEPSVDQVPETRLENATGNMIL